MRRICLVFGLILFVACAPRKNTKPSLLGLTQAETAQLLRAGEYLKSLQRPDGAITAPGTSSDSAVGQTGYALGALSLIEAEFGGFEKTLSEGRRFLLTQVEKDGLWKYQKFLPADLDDTTAALTGLGREAEVEKAAIEKGIQNILRLQTTDGGLRTWLIDDAAIEKLGPNAAAFRVAEPHAEVMSYFFEFLHRWDAPRFKTPVEAAAAFVASRQEKSGAWKTVWYRSDDYAINRAIRLLTATPALAEKHRVHIATARNYVLKNDTSAALLDKTFAVGTLSAMPGANISALTQRVAEVVNRQQANGSWPAEPFFFLDIAQRGKLPQDIIYIQSELYSTALVIENLMLFYRARKRLA